MPNAPMIQPATGHPEACHATAPPVSSEISMTSRTGLVTGTGARPDRLGSPGTLKPPQIAANAPIASMAAASPGQPSTVLSASAATPPSAASSSVKRRKRFAVFIAKPSTFRAPGPDRRRTEKTLFRLKTLRTPVPGDRRRPVGDRQRPALDEARGLARRALLRVRQHRGQQRRLPGCKPPRSLAEGMHRRGFDAEDTLVELRHVHVDLDDPLLRPDRLQNRREHRFERLSWPGAALPEKHVLHSLLRQGRGAANRAVVDRGADRAHVEPPMQAEIGILRCDDGSRDGRSDILDRNPAVLEGPEPKALGEHVGSCGRADDGEQGDEQHGENRERKHGPQRPAQGAFQNLPAEEPRKEAPDGPALRLPRPLLRRPLRHDLLLSRRPPGLKPLRSSRGRMPQNSFPSAALPPSFCPLIDMLCS